MIHKLEKDFFGNCYFLRFVKCFDFDRVEKFVVYFGLHEPSLHF